MPASSRPRPAVLCILDGWGHRPDRHYNAILDARTPNYDRLIATCPQGLIDASETFVGLPKGQMGNSEVGHMNLGAGRVAVPDLPRIDNAIADGSLAKNPILTELIASLKKNGGACHLMGLASPGGVHAHQDHLVALANHDRRRRRAGMDPCLPRRPGHAAAQCAGMPAAHPGRPEIGPADPLRDDRRPVLPHGSRQALGARGAGLRRHGRRRQGGERARTPAEAVDKGYKAGLDDEFVLPTVIEGYTGMKDGDGLLMFNYRSDRARQILTALLDPRFDGFNRARVVKFADAVGMVEYSAALNPFLKTLFPPAVIKMGLGETVAKAGLKQLRIAETEKYAHVTFFFNGGEERSFEGEERILVPSPKVKTYDLKPEMSAPEVTDKLVEAIGSGKFDLIVVNYANSDMVGHTGDLAAAVKAIEAVDACLGRLMDGGQEGGRRAADHRRPRQRRADVRRDDPPEAHPAHAQSRAGAAVQRPGQDPFIGRRQAGGRGPHDAGADGRAAAPGNDRSFAAFRGLAAGRAGRAARIGCSFRLICEAP